MNKWLWPVFSVVIFMITGCGDNDATDQKLISLIQRHGLTGDPSACRIIPSIEDEKAQLGMKLFFTKTMSIPGDTACVSCHHPLLGGGDGVSIAIGTGAVDTDIFGYDRELNASEAVYYGGSTGPTQTVNSPTTYNAALQDRFMAWHGIIEAADPDAGFNGSQGGIYDPDSTYNPDNTRNIDPFAGENIPAAQSRFPVQNPIEMAGHGNEIKGLDSFGIRKILVDRLTGENNNTFLTPEQRDAWLKAFRKAYDDKEANATTLITDANIYNLISYYERTQLFIENAWKRYVEGDTTALSEDAKKGAILFFSNYDEGGANCVQCHKGDFFTDNDLHVMAVPQIGRGTQPDGDSYGREEITKDPADRYKWRTMSLLNVEKTGPWGHDGAFTSLRAMVKHMLDPSTPYDSSQIKQKGMQNLDTVEVRQQKALAQLEYNREHGISPHKAVKLSEEEVDQLVEFLKSLTDPRLNDYDFMKRWVPDYNDPESQLLNLQEAKFLPPEATQP